MSIVLFSVGLGGGIGAVCRYLLTKGLENRGIPIFLATLLINVIGSFLIGITMKLAFVLNSLEAFITVGILGGFTTFSTFTFEIIKLMEQGKLLKAITYIISTLLFSILALTIGYTVVK